MAEDTEHDETPGSWQPDPYGRHERRWWDGSGFTRRVADSKLQGIDPPVIDSRPVGAPSDLPVEPITDARLPLRGPAGDRVLVAMAIALLVLICLVVLAVVVAVA